VTRAPAARDAARSALRADELRPLLERHLALLRAHVRDKAGAGLLSREPLSDLVQSVALEVLLDADHESFDDEAAFRRWVWRVATNKILEKHRRWSAAKRSACRESSLDPDLAFDSSEAPDARAERAEELGALAAALEQLDDDLREVLLLRRVFDVPPPVVAAELGIAESTVRWRTAQALARLAAKLGTSGSDGRR
jgi:RNA polymerase sigma factor (sigma-70 family)